MSAFQIPGLGQAKPNEVLPPLPLDVIVANTASAAAQDNEMKDSDPEPASAPSAAAAAAASNAASAEAIQPEGMKEADIMEIDQSENLPSLTGALEAAIGGLDDESAEEQAAAPEQQQQQQQQQEIQLGPDQSEHPEWEIDSSPYESSSESSSSDSSDDDDDEEDSDNEGYEPLGVEETARLLMEMEGGSDDEGEKGGKGSGAGYMRTKNELPEETIAKPDVTITPEMKIEELGIVEHMVENIMLIKAFTPGEYQVLDTGSVLCNADRVVIGAIAETIGKVLQPMYTVMFSSAEEMKELGVEVGAKVFYPVDHASFVFTQPLKNIKGSDASNLHDEEVGDEEMEFSDDEKEAEYKRSLKQKKKDKWKNNNSNNKDKEPHPLRQEFSAADDGLNYDEDGGDDDGPYKPLARPAGYGAGPVSVENYEPRSRPNFQRGRGRDFRGRGGNRGRPSGRGGRGGGGGGFNASRDGYSLPPQGNNHHAQQSHAPLTPPTQHTIPTLSNFGFPLPGWPQPPIPTPGQTPLFVPPPPPPPPVPSSSWSAQSEGGQQVPNGAFVNPAFFAALMSQFQAQGGQGAWHGQQQQQPPSSG